MKNCDCGCGGEGYCEERSNAFQWISVKDRLPKRTEHKEILTFQMVGDKDGKMVPHISIDLIKCLYVRKGHLYSDFGSEEVTHWMPLPEPSR